jgi:UDP-glucose 4-epimerase
MAKVLVVGGAGYIGSTACAWLLDQGHEVWVLDDLSTGHRAILDRLKGLRGFVQARAGDAAVVGPLLARERFDCVMHFAASCIVSESVAQPDRYYENNVMQTRSLLEQMLKAGVKRLVFSSTCAVFGSPAADVELISEATPKSPVNPYGSTKLEVEKMLENAAATDGLQAVALRYFNVAGAEPHGRVGEWHEPETHLVPSLLGAALKGEPVEVYGTDFGTPDGTAIRDYIDVWELVAVHGAAMQQLLVRGAGGSFEAYNLGSENGYSVREMLKACEHAIGRKIASIERPRRAGDPSKLVGDSRLARKVLGFAPAKDSLKRIFTSAWKWEQGLGALKNRKAVFLDRDGTINFDPGYLSGPEQMRLLPGVGEALGSLSRAGFALIVVSNQSGVGRGKITREALPLIHARMEELLAAHGARVDHYGLCVHLPEDGCECRKPKPKLLIDTARAMGVALARSYMVGDKHSDIQAGRAAGCRASVLVRTGYGAETERKLAAGEAAFIGASLKEAAQWILAQENAGP